MLMQVQNKLKKNTKKIKLEIVAKLIFKKNKNCDKSLFIFLLKLERQKNPLGLWKLKALGQLIINYICFK